jgi:HD-GYP domain-containing protein (c-di-GMP phosphodiesterase class II)
VPALQIHQAMDELTASFAGALSRPALLALLRAAPDDLLEHGVHVAYLAILLGLRLQAYLVEQRPRLCETRAKEVFNLGLGCLLHDIGETRLSPNDRESQAGELGPQGDWKKHAAAGFQSVRAHTDPSATAVVLHHHQHYDGTGFPLLGQTTAGQRESQIHVFARMAMAADTFCHLLQHDGVPMPVVYALWRIQQPACRSWFDPVVLPCLLDLIPPFAPGVLVGLSDDRNAVVVRHHAQAPCCPTVQILSTNADDSGDMDAHTGEQIDLRQCAHLSIRLVDGVDVSGYLYGCQGFDKFHTDAQDQELMLAT